MARSLLLCLALFAGSAHAADSWNEPRAPFCVAGNTWYVGTQGITMLLIRGEQGAVLIDAALPESVPRLRASLETLGVPLDEIKLILTSHAHFDHAGALAELKALTGARVIASPESATLLRAGGKGDLHFGDSVAYAAVSVDDTLVDGETVTLGELALTAHFTPGHTPGSTSWTWTEREGEREVHMVYGDSLTAPGYRLIDHPQRPALVDEFRSSFATLRTLPCDLLITPHPDVSDLFGRHERGALIDAGTCKRYADRSEKALDAQVARQRNEASAG